MRRIEYTRAGVRMPPGPATPGWIQTLRWTTGLLPFLDQCQRRFGDIFTLRTYRNELFVLVSSPASHEAIFTAEPEAMRVANRYLAPLLGQHSLLILNGPPHRRHRRLLAPPFNGKRMRLYAELIHGLSLHHLHQADTQGPIGAQLPIQAVFRTISLEVILRAVLGMGEDRRELDAAAACLCESADSFNTLVVFFEHLQRDLGPGSPGRRFVRGRAAARSLLDAQIAARRRDRGEHHDILSLLIDARDDQGGALSDEEIRDELLTLVLAGHETTATALAWAVHFILQTPGVLPRLLAELRELGPDPDPERYAKLPYLAAICDETMRRMPTVPNLGRYTQRPMVLDGYELPSKTMVVPVIYLTHQRPDIYPDPTRFEPERFLGRNYRPFEYLPFGGGVRRCLGAAFALFEMRIVLGALFAHYRVRALSTDTRPVRRTIVVAPRGGTRVQLERRVRS